MDTVKSINHCGEPDKLQERLSSHKATASQPILVMRGGTLDDGTSRDFKNDLRV